MTNYIAVFRSKTDVFSFIDILRARGVSAEITATPREAHIGCGLSVRFPMQSLNLARAVTRSGVLPSFFAFYAVTRMGTRTSIMRIN